MKNTSKLKAIIVISIFALFIAGGTGYLIYQLSYVSLIGKETVRVDDENLNNNNLVEIDASLCGYKVSFQEAGLDYRVVYNKIQTTPPVVSALIEVKRIDFKKAREIVHPFNQESYDEWKESIAQNTN